MFLTFMSVSEILYERFFWRYIKSFCFARIKIWSLTLFLYFLEYIMLCLVLLYRHTKKFLRIWPFLGYHTVGWSWIPIEVIHVQTSQLYLESRNSIHNCISISYFPEDLMLPGGLPESISFKVVPVNYSPLWDSYFKILYSSIIKATRYKVEERYFALFSAVSDIKDLA